MATTSRQSTTLHCMSAISTTRSLSDIRPVVEVRAAVKRVIFGGLTANPAKIDRLLVFSRPVMPNETLPELTPMLSARSEKDNRELSGILTPGNEAADKMKDRGETAPESEKPIGLFSSLKMNVPAARQ